MAQPFTLDLIGFAEIQQKMLTASERMSKDVEGVLERNAQIIARNAKRSAPTDEGYLKGQISVTKDGKLAYGVVSPARYSPFIEWGTKRRAKVPAELQNYALQFKGLKTGSAEEALNAIAGWVKRKGIKFASAGKKKLTVEQTAYIIFHFIMINGIKPKPFFFHNFNNQRPIIIENVKDIIGDIF